VKRVNMLTWRTARMLVVAVIFAVGGLVAIGPAQASHGNDYNPQNNDVYERRDTIPADIETDWSNPPNYMDPICVAAQNNDPTTYRFHGYVWKRSNGALLWDSTLITLDEDEGYQWGISVAQVADVHEPYITVVKSTINGGYVTTYTMDPYQWLGDKLHDETAYSGAGPCATGT